MSHQVKSWFGPGAPDAASHPAVRSLAAKWLQIKAERDPVLADFWHDADDAFLDNAILFLRGAEDYTYLHHGRALRDRIGFSMQGLTLGELRTRVRTRLLEIYDRAADSFELAYFQSFADFQQDVVLWGRLCLPLRLNHQDERVAILLYCHPIEDKASLSRTVFERTASGVVIAAPVRGEGGRIEDAWIIAQNERAARLTGILDHATGDLLLRHAPIFGRDDVWSYLMDGIAGGPRLAALRDSSRNLAINLSAELVDEYLVLRLTEMGAEPRAFTLD